MSIFYNAQNSCMDHKQPLPCKFCQIHGEVVETKSPEEIVKETLDTMDGIFENLGDRVKKAQERAKKRIKSSNDDELSVGDKWYIKLPKPNSIALQPIVILELTDKTVLLTYHKPDKDEFRFKISDIEFVEKIDAI